MLSTTNHFKDFKDVDGATKKNVFYRFYLKNSYKNKRELDNIVQMGISAENFHERKANKKHSKKTCFSKWRSFWKLNPCTDSVKENIIDAKMPTMLKMEPPKSLPLTRRHDHVNYGPLVDAIDIDNPTHKPIKCSSSVIESPSGSTIVSSPPPLPLRKSLPQVNQIDSNFYNRSANASQSLSIAYPKCPKSNQTIDNFRHLRRVPWYWGPLSKYDAELLLQNKEDGIFLVRDSGHEAYVLSVSFRAGNKTYHTRIEHSLGKFSFWLNDRNAVKAATIVDFINQLIEESRNGHVRYLINDSYLNNPFTENGRVSVSLLYPFSRFKTVQSLLHLCRFEIVLLIRQDHINSLQIPNFLKTYLKAPQYFIERIEDFIR